MGLLQSPIRRFLWAIFIFPFPEHRAQAAASLWKERSPAEMRLSGCSKLYKRENKRRNWKPIPLALPSVDLLLSVKACARNETQGVMPLADSKSAGLLVLNCVLKCGFQFSKYRAWLSAAKVWKAREVFPEPDLPTITFKLFLGRWRSIPFRLLVRTPFSTMASWAAVNADFCCELRWMALNKLSKWA